MKKTRIAATVVALALAAPLFAASGTAHAQGAPSDGFGLGLELGEVDGLSGKYWLNQSNALQFALSFDYGYYYHGPGVTFDYLWHPSVLTQGSVARLLWHVGVGAEVGFGSDRYYYYNNHPYRSSLGVRVPIGLDILFNEQPFDIFLEAAPTLFIAPGYFDVWGALGGRYYF
jgi:hypothetical protein